MINSHLLMIAHSSPFFFSHPNLKQRIETAVSERNHLLPSLLPFVQSSFFITHRPKWCSFPPDKHRFCKLYTCWLLIALAQQVTEVLLHNLWSVQKKMTAVTNQQQVEQHCGHWWDCDVHDAAWLPLVSTTLGNIGAIYSDTDLELQC